MFVPKATPNSAIESAIVKTMGMIIVNSTRD
jgi:hypothetical protein